MIKVVDTQNIKNSEKQMFLTETTPIELMKKAGVGCIDNFDFCGKIAIICGTGNNAGDGFVIANELINKKIININELDLFLINQKFSEAGQYYYDQCKNNNININIYNKDTDLSKYDVIVDCIFGIGVRDELDDKYINVINNINDVKNKNNKIKIVSIDINSGLNSDNGLGDHIVKSDITLSIGYYKLGHFLNKSKDYIKNKKNIDIGIKLLNNSYLLYEYNDIKKLFKNRPEFSNKGSFGKVCLLGGSIEYSGSIRLSNLSIVSLRSGAGLTIVAVPKCILPIISNNILESIIYPLDSDDNNIIFNEKQIDDLMNKADVITCGMGIGRSKEAEKILCYLLTKYNKKLVIDADGLYLLSKNINLLNNFNAKIILTPHLKEFERLYNASFNADLNTNQILKNQLQYGIEFSKKHNVVLILKGTTNLIIYNDKVSLVDRGTSGMAVAGSGDVLSGILTGFLGYFEDIYEASIASVYVNGLAGEMSKDEYGKIGMISSDTAKNVAKVIKMFEQ